MTDCVKALVGAMFVTGEAFAPLIVRCGVHAVPLGTGRASDLKPDRR
jgi:hypothetical protein